MDYNDVQSVKEIYWKNKWESLWELHGENFKLLRFYVARSGLWKQAAKKMREEARAWKRYADGLNIDFGLAVDRWHESRATADRRLELLKEVHKHIKRYHLSCPCCHIEGCNDDCELEKELKDASILDNSKG